MQINDKTLPSMKDFPAFKDVFENHALTEVRKALLSPQIALHRLHDAHFAWQDDVKRLSDMERNLKDGADHFKQCAALAYWLRRMSPVVDYIDWFNPDGDDLHPHEVDLRDLIARYGTEYIAFDLGFQICAYYETERVDSPRQFYPNLTGEYLVDVCHMMKFKHVSPHSLYLVYKSIFIS